jgi:hypothetical protein
MTAAALAHRGGVPVETMRAWLEEWARQGIVERAGDEWRLSAEGERLFGEALRTLAPLDEEEAA